MIPTAGIGREGVWSVAKVPICLGRAYCKSRCPARLLVREAWPACDADALCDAVMWSSHRHAGALLSGTHCRGACVESP
jgi:hypothetical protein